MKRALFILFTVLALLLCSLYVFRAYLGGVVCRGKLGSVIGSKKKASSVSKAFYEARFDGAFPPSLTQLVVALAFPLTNELPRNPPMTENLRSALSLCKCPHTETQIGSLTNLGEWSDYLYVHWPSGRSETPGQYPIMYDRRLDNHNGAGINIVLVDGTVLWDRDADWLQDFANQHPELKIPLPEEVRTDTGEALP